MLISCLCVTRNRREWLPKAIACFQSQTWTAKELIILADQLSDVRGVRIEDERIRVYIPKETPTWTLGEKRNESCRLAKGELLCNFDDDDHSAADRLAYQAAILLESGKSVVGLKDILFTDGRDWWLNRNWPGGYGSTLLYKRAYWAKNKYPRIGEGEDWEFVSRAMQKNQFVVAEAKEYFVATIHTENSAKRVVGEGWELLDR